VLDTTDGKGDKGLEVVVFALFLIGAYVLSLYLNPWVTCSRCKGKPRPRAWVFGYAHHVCPKCQGTGQQRRLGSRLLGFGRDKPSS
jgi:DnaJ-class molecular chaperone